MGQVPARWWVGGREGEGAMNMWVAPAGVLVREATGWAGAWTLTYAAGQGAVHLAGMAGRDDDLRVTYASLDLALALTEIEAAHPQAAATAVAVDLGAAAPIAGGSAERILAELVAATGAVIDELLAADDVTVADILACARISNLLSSAQDKLTGRPW